MFKKELINQSRVLTMSHNRRVNYLIVNCGNNNATIMGVKNNINTDDIIFIREIYGNHIDELVDRVKDICYEHDVQNVLIGTCGFDRCFYDTFKLRSNIHIFSIEEKGTKSSIYNIFSDIESCKIRFLQTYKCAKNSYVKPFLGYSAVIDSHKETDILVKEMENLVLEVSPTTGCVLIKKMDDNIKPNRFTCLLMYYNYLHQCKANKIN